MGDSHLQEGKMLTFIKIYISQCGNFRNFSVTQILREINFWDSRSAKSAFFTHLEALNLILMNFLLFLKGEIDQINNTRSPKVAEKSDLALQESSKIDFT